MITKSDTIGELTKAFVAARANIKHPPRNKVNPHFRNHYADLTAVLDAVEPEFCANGLALLQFVDGTQLVTIIAHTSGEFLSSAADLPPFSNAQQEGSALTYLRRYTVQALAGIAADDDDDGEAASTKTSKPKAKKGSPSKADAPTSDGDDW